VFELPISAILANKLPSALPVICKSSKSPHAKSSYQDLLPTRAENQIWRLEGRGFGVNGFTASRHIFVISRKAAFKRERQGSMPGKRVRG
jgi:hypothetical protein